MTGLIDLPYNKEERMKKFWVCYVEGTKVERFYKHETLQEATKEAERLARLPDRQGRTVYLFECIGKCQIEPALVKWDVTRY